jgi:ABC-2 type transport system permease protein
VYRFRPLVVSGDFDTVLVKPVHPFVRVLLGGFDVLDVLPTILYFIFAGYLISIIPEINPLSLITYIGLLINGLVIATAFHILVLAVGILSSEVDHTIMIYRDVTRLAAFPMEIYSEPLRSVLTFVIPIGLMVSNPVKSLLGLLSLFL